MDNSAPLFDRTSKYTAFEQAWVYITEAAIELERELNVPISRWNEMTIAQLGIHWAYGIDYVRPNANTLYYQVTDHAACVLAIQATRSPDAFDAAKMIAFANIWNGQPMPEALRHFAARLVNGMQQRPKQQGGGITNFFLRWQIYTACQRAHELFGLSIVRQDYGEQNSAADLLSQLADQFEQTYSYNTIRDWFVHRDYAKFRKRCKHASEYLNEKYLFEIGAIKKLSGGGL